MEKKTIGSFIATLRKANGMTQKDLAEKLNVSDKTISRWERNDGAPDLSAIPAIAEIFGVTCDELLRGERKAPEVRAEMKCDEEISPKADKQRQRLLKATLSQYQTRTYIAIGLSAVGLLFALIGNLAFLRAVLGFLMGACFYVPSIICQIIFVNRACVSVEDAELNEEDYISFKQRVFDLAIKSIGLTTTFIGFTFPLILVDAYVGLGADSLLIWGGLGAALFLGIYISIVYFLLGAWVRKGIYPVAEKDIPRYTHNRNLKKKCGIGLVTALILTLCIHAFGFEMIWNPYTLARGETFNDYESFIAFMEQDIPYDSDEYWTGAFTSAQDSAAVPENPSLSITEEITWVDEYGNEISEEEAITRTLRDANGNVVCSYLERNKAVSTLRYEPKDGTILPITVITNSAYQTARTFSQLITTLFFVFYPIEVILAVFIYFRRRIK